MRIHSFVFLITSMEDISILFLCVCVLSDTVQIRHVKIYGNVPSKRSFRVEFLEFFVFQIKKKRIKALDWKYEDLIDAISVPNIRAKLHERIATYALEKCLRERNHLATPD